MNKPHDDGLLLHRHAFFAMGSDCELFLLSHSGGVEAAAAAETEVRRIESRYSRYRPDSALSRINQAAASGGWIRVDQETAWLLRYAVRAHAASNGAFDISSGLLRAAWDFSQARLPDQSTLDALCPRIGMDKVRLSGGHLSFTQAGMELDLGGLGKEYAADRAAALLRGMGVRHGFVNLSGDIAVIGAQPDGSPWRIGISEPGARERARAVVALGSGGLATSGDYERFTVVDGRHYSHILDPRTGWPSEGMTSVTVMADSCLEAGIMATAAMVKGTDGAAWLHAHGLRYLAIGADGRASGTAPTGSTSRCSTESCHPMTSLMG